MGADEESDAAELIRSKLGEPDESPEEPEAPEEPHVGEENTGKPEEVPAASDTGQRQPSETEPSSGGDTDEASERFKQLKEEEMKKNLKELEEKEREENEADIYDPEEEGNILH